MWRRLVDSYHGRKHCMLSLASARQVLKYAFQLQKTMAAGTRESDRSYSSIVAAGYSSRKRRENRTRNCVHWDCGAQFASSLVSVLWLHQVEFLYFLRVAGGLPLISLFLPFTPPSSLLSTSMSFVLWSFCSVEKFCLSFWTFNRSCCTSFFFYAPRKRYYGGLTSVFSVRGLSKIFEEGIPTVGCWSLLGENGKK